MEQTKADVLKRGNITNQQALVNALKSKTVKPVRRTIPGGTKMLSELDSLNLERAVYNWLRGKRSFEQVTICFAKNPKKYRTQEQKIVDFPEDGPDEIWTTHPDGKQYLAKVIAESLNQYKAIYLTAKRDGLYVATDPDEEFSPESSDWEPYIEFLPKKLDQY